MTSADEAIRQILAERDRRQAASGQVPLYARQHEYDPGTPGGTCEACGEYADDGRHQGQQAPGLPGKEHEMTGTETVREAECVNCDKRSPVASMRYVEGIGHLCTDIAACDARLEAEVTPFQAG